MIALPHIIVSEKAERSLRGGHVWVFADEVRNAETTVADGALAHVFSQNGKFLGTGFYNSASKIRVRVCSDNANDTFDEAFWRRRVRWAIDYRRTVMGADFSACRLIFGEADGFPGFTVDRFGEVLVTEVLCLGIERIKPLLYRLLREELTATGESVRVLYEKNDGAIRALEGMESTVGYWLQDGYEVGTGRTEIVENGIRFGVNYEAGQKTGFFLDQKYNRAAVARIARGMRVLDCFTHTGAFALNAAAAGAAHVTAVDISAEAIAEAKRNAALNGLSGKIDFIPANVFDFLRELGKNGKCDYDLIILDPPAFTKSRDTLKNAIRGYREINAAAMRLLRRGSYLATCSCSHFMTDTYFCQMLHNAAEDAAVTLRQIEARGQAPDHPVRWNVPETEYLKFYIFQIT